MNAPALEVSCPTCGAGKGERCYGSNPQFAHTDRYRKHIAYTLHPSNRQSQHEEALKLTQSSSFHKIG